MAEFADAVESLSPTQRAFATAFRNMQARGASDRADAESAALVARLEVQNEAAVIAAAREAAAMRESQIRATGAPCAPK